MNTPAEFDAWLTKAQDLSFIEERGKLEEICTQFTKEGDSSQADYRSVTGGKPGVAVYTPVGAKFHQDRYTAGKERVTKFKTFSLGVINPWQLLKDMAANKRVRKEKIKFFQQINKDLLEGHRKAKEIITADFLVRADSTTVTTTWPGTGRDALALASSSHKTLVSGDTWSSIQTGAALSPLTLKEAITKLNNQPDENGYPQAGVSEVIILCGRYYEWRIPEILKSTNMPDTDLNNVNSVKTGPASGAIKYRVAINPWVGDSEKGWMVIDAKNHSLLRFEKDKPFLSTAVDPYTDNRITKCIMRYAIDFDSAKGVVFNPGPA